MGEREPRDVLGEALRRERYGLIRPLWADMPDDHATKITWISRADIIIARLAEAGYRIVGGKDG